MFTYLVDKTITTHTLAVDRLQNIALHNIVILILTITYDTNKYKVDINTVQDTHYQYCNINITNTEQYDVDTDTITQLPCQYQSSQIHNITVFVWFRGNFPSLGHLVHISVLVCERSVLMS